MHRRAELRNEVMYGSAGVIYLYLCYGMHWLLNIVCREEGYPAAVLLMVLLGVRTRQINQKMGIDGELNRKPATIESGLWFEKVNLRNLTLKWDQE